MIDGEYDSRNNQVQKREYIINQAGILLEEDYDTDIDAQCVGKFEERKEEGSILIVR